MSTLLVVLALVQLVVHALHWRTTNTLQGGPVTKRVKGGKKTIVCPRCGTAYTFAQCRIEKTGLADKALVQCAVCEGLLIEVSFDKKGRAQCQI